MSDRYFRVRVRNPANTADDLILSSRPGDANEYVIEAPTGDGQTLDPVTSTVDVGEYTILVGDPSGARPVTVKLVDAPNRWALLGRLTYIETTTTLAGAWTVVRVGWLTGLTQVDALEWEIRVGEAQRTERETAVYEFLSDAFPVGTAIIGGPVRGGVGGPDHGGWRFGVASLNGQLVELDFRSGMFPVGESGYKRATSDVPVWVFLRLYAAARPFRYPVSGNPFGAASAVPGFWYPDLRVRVQSVTTGASLGDFTPVSSLSPRIRTVLPMLYTRAGRLRIVWDTAVHGPQPTVGTLLDVYVTPQVVSPEFPLHWTGHPVAAVTAHYDAAGIAYDAASAASVTAALGPLRLERRITSATTLAAEVDRLGVAFGFSRRVNGAGAYEFFLTRRRGAAAPAVEITTADLRDADAPTFDLVESSIVNQVTVRAQDVVPWATENEDAPDEGRPWDDRETVEREYTINPEPPSNPLDPTEQARFGVHGVTITIPGTIVGQGPIGRVLQRARGLLTGKGEDIRFPFAEALARELFGMGLRGAPEGTLHCLTPVAAVGDEVVVSLPWNIDPTAVPAVRGGSRVMRVLQATPVPGGIDLRVRDSGRSVVIATVPTITLAADPDRPRTSAVVTITNAAALAAAGVSVRLEWATGAVAPAGNGATAARVDPATATTVALPPVDSGTVVHVRSQSVTSDDRPSAFSAWATLDLADIPPPTVLTVTAVASDGTALDAAWTVGDATLRTLVAVQAAGDAAPRVVTILPAASTRYRVTALAASTLHTITVEHLDDLPLLGRSAVASANGTTTGLPTLSAPSAPAVFAGSYDEGGVTVPVEGGTYGLDVTATVLPSSTEFEEATETAVGSGVPGSYARVATTASSDSDRTRYVAIAPSDGRLRYLRARHLVGTAVSAYTTALSVDPWGRTTAPVGPRAKEEYVELLGGVWTRTFAARASDAAGLALDPAARTRDTAGDRPVLRGTQKGQARHGDAITFAPPYQSPPQIRLSGSRAITHEPRAKYNASGDGTGAGAYQAGKPTFADLLALNVSASGFTMRARLRQPDATITTRTHNFPANTLTAAGQFAEVTLANAPANNDQYACRYTVSVGGTANSGVVNISTVIAVDTWESTTSIATERAVSPTYTHTEEDGVPSPGPTVTTDWLTATVSGLDALDKIRVRIKSITVLGDGTASVTVVAHTGTAPYTAPGVQYTTSAAADLYASMTPPSDTAAVIDWEAFEVSA